MTTIGCTGHQNIPVTALAYVESQMRKAIAGYGVEQLTGVSSLAIGADQMFADLVLAIGGRFNAVIPCDQYETTFDNEDRQRYAALLNRASSVEKLPFARPSEDAYLAAGRRVVDRSDALIAVWDGREAQGKGGTGDIVAYAKRAAVTVTIIWPPGVRR